MTRKECLVVFMKELLLPSKRLIFSSSHQSFDLLLRFNTTNNNNNIMRRKNPHPQRAVNGTVLKVSGEREGKRREEQPPVLCLRIPDEDDDLEAIIFRYKRRNDFY